MFHLSSTREWRSAMTMINDNNNKTSTTKKAATFRTCACVLRVGLYILPHTSIHINQIIHSARLPVAEIYCIHVFVCLCFFTLLFNVVELKSELEYIELWLALVTSMWLWNSDFDLRFEYGVTISLPLSSPLATLVLYFTSKKNITLTYLHTDKRCKYTYAYMQPINYSRVHTDRNIKYILVHMSRYISLYSNKCCYRVTINFVLFANEFRYIFVVYVNAKTSQPMNIFLLFAQSVCKRLPCEIDHIRNENLPNMPTKNWLVHETRFSEFHKLNWKQM